MFPCETVAIAVLSKHTLFGVVQDGGKVTDNEVVSVVLEFTGFVGERLLICGCVLLAGGMG